MPKAFVKSADTSTPVANSRGEIERVLRRYNAAGFSVAQDYAEHRFTVSFVVPNSPDKDAQRVPVKLPIDVRLVYDALYGQPKRWDGVTCASVYDPKGYDEKKLQQAERVAWRHAVLLIDAALTAASARIQTVTEALFAHLVVPTDAGPRRMIDLVEEQQSYLGPGVRALLAAPADVEISR